MPTVASVQRLSKIYRKPGTNVEVHALREVDLDLVEGQFTAIMGASGSGKSTLMNILGSLDQSTIGHYILGGQDIISLADHQSTAARVQHNADGTYGIRSDQAQADELLGTFVANRHNFKGNFVWDLPDVHRSGSVTKAIGLVLNDWQLSSVWTAATGTAYTVGFSYQNGGSSVNLTGSPSYGARIRLVGDPGSGCSSNALQQFNTAAFQGPLPGSVGLESGADYLRGCFSNALDLAFAFFVLARFSAWSA